MNNQQTSSSGSLKPLKLDIVAGFLGAGKTTLINKLLHEAIPASQTVLIENEFGEVSIDDALFSDNPMNVRTLASGCICCTLSSNFAEMVPEIIETYHPEHIIIEPTGMASPTDLLNICMNVCTSSNIRINSFISVINAQNLERILKFNIPAFESQFECLSYVVLTHLDNMDPGKIDQTIRLLSGKIGSDIKVIAQPLDQIDVMMMYAEAEEALVQNGVLANFELTPVAHHHHHHISDSITSHSFYPSKPFTENDLYDFADALNEGSLGTVLRAKGFFNSDKDGMLHFEYVDGSTQIEQSNYDGAQKCVVIGININESSLQKSLSTLKE